MTSARGGAPLTSSRDAPLGGQAVLEGVMMRGVATWAVAVRLPAGDRSTFATDRTTLAGDRPTFTGARPTGPLGAIEVGSFSIDRPAHPRLRRVPVLRGVLALWSSMSIGLRALAIAARAQLPRENGEPPEVPRGVWVGTAVLSIVFAVALFFVAPVSITSLVRGELGSSWLFWLVEGVLRTAIFLAYLMLVSRMGELRRVLEYHGAEHKVISCHEAGDELTPERAERYSRLHPRCGTSFLLVVMIISIFIFAPIGLPAWWILVLTRIVGVPVIAGLAFEVIRFAGRHRARRWVAAVIWPGLQLQRLTTREPDRDELAVSIAALQAVLAAEAPGARQAEELLGLEVVA